MWALCLATLVLVSSLFTAVFRETPDYVIAVLVLCAFVAAAVGVLLNWRLDSAHSEALRDPLTGLPNRVLLDDRIEQALRHSRRSAEPFTLIAVDLDGFKDVNDVRGHRAGDAVLKTLARRFEAIVREADTVARVGGDEFVVLSIGTGSDERAGALVGRLRNALRKPFRIDGTPVEIDGSIGWAVYPDDGRQPRICSPAPTGRCTRRSGTPSTTRCSSVEASTPGSSGTSSRRSSRTSSSSSTSRSSTSPRGRRARPRR